MKYCKRCGMRMDDSCVVCPKCQASVSSQVRHTVSSTNTRPETSTVKRAGKAKMLLALLPIAALVGLYLCIESIPRWVKTSRLETEKRTFEAEKMQLARMTQEELDRGVSSGDAKCLHEASRRTMDAAVSSGDISVERFDTAFGQSLAAAELASINTLGGSWNIEIRSLLDCWRQSVRQMPGSIYSRDKNFAKRVNDVLGIREDSPFYIEPDESGTDGGQAIKSQGGLRGNGDGNYGGTDSVNPNSSGRARPIAKPMD